MTDRDRLFRQDWRNSVNLLRASFTSWYDRAIALVFLLVAAMAVRAWFDIQPLRIASAAAAVAGIALGIGFGRLLHRRLGFHAGEGILAADALTRWSRHRYLLRWHGIALLSIILILFFARPVLSLIGGPSYAIGAAIATMTSALPAGRWRRWRPGSAVAVMTARAEVGVVLAIAVLLALLILRGIDPMAHRAAAALLTVIAMSLVTRVDDAIVRFLTVSGFGTGRIVAHHLRAAIVCAFVLLNGTAILFDRMTAVIVAGCCVTLSGLLVLRILAYRLHRRSFADMIVAIVVGLMLTTGFTFPIALPVVAVAILWQMQQRAARRIWLVP